MKVSAVRSDSVYSKIMSAPLDKKNDIYRYELMMPFERKWACYNVPMKAKTPNGYDVIMASRLFGHIEPTKVDETQKQNIQLISGDAFWEKCEMAIRKSLNCFIEHGIDLPVQEYLFTILLANAESPYIKLYEGYCGDELAKLQNFPQVGLPYCAGYACGYHLVKHYLKKTGKSIIEATLLSAKEILDTAEDFWND